MNWKNRLLNDALLEEDKISHKPSTLSNFKTQLRYSTRQNENEQEMVMNNMHMEQSNKTSNQ